MNGFAWLAFVAILCYASYGEAKSIASAKPGTRMGHVKPYKLKASQVPDHITTDDRGFPKNLEYSIEIDGQITTLNLAIERSIVAPEDFVRHKNGRSEKRNGPTANIAFYSDFNGQGTFVCKSRGKDGNGKVICRLNGLINIHGETCYLGWTADGGADCGTPLEEGLTIDAIHEDMPEQPVRRHRSYTPYPEPGFKVVEVAYLVDANFMQPFYDRNTNVAAAQEEATLFVTLLNIEMNIYYQSIKAASNGELDVYVYPAVVMYPEAGSDFPMVEASSDGTFLYNNVTPALKQMLGSGDIPQPWDHVMLITGLNVKTNNGGGVLGYAFVGTMCNTGNGRMSVVEFRVADVSRIAAHEIGHALGAKHDENPEECPTKQYIMSATIVKTTQDRLDTYHTFSTCSARQIQNTLSGRPDCLANGFTDNQFREFFCTGLLGEEQFNFGLDFQCKVRTGFSGSVACGTVTSDEGCYESNYMKCTTETDQCAKTSIGLRYVWNGTPCAVGKHCYQGLCVPVGDTCSNR